MEKIKDFFTKLLDAVRSVIEGQGTLNTTARAGQKAAQQVPVLDDFFNALDNAIDNRQRMLDGEQNSTESGSIETIRLSKKIDTPLSEATNDVLSMADEKAKQNAAEDTYIRIIKNTPQVILEHVNGSEDLEVIMRFDKYYLAARHDGVLNGHYHNLGTLMSELPRYIEQPDAIIRLENGRLNVISDLGGKNGLISIELSTVKDINRKNQLYNLVVTAFEPKTNYLKNTIKKAVKVHYEKRTCRKLITNCMSGWQLLTTNPLTPKYHKMDLMSILILCRMGIKMHRTAKTTPGIPWKWTVRATN